MAEGESEELLPGSFEARLEKAHILHGLLQGINVKKNPTATVSVRQTGIKFSVEESLIWQAAISLGNDMFQSFRSTDDVGEFKIPLKVFLDCLTIYGSLVQTLLVLQYQGYGQPLRLTLMQDKVVTEVMIRTMDCDNIQHFGAVFHEGEVISKVIIQSPPLREAFNELDWSNEFITILISPDAPYFKFSTSGASGSCQMSFPRHSEAFDEFHCEQTQSFLYKLAHLQPAIKAAGPLATKTQIRLNDKGMMCMQHMLCTEDRQACFVDFYVLPTEEDGTNIM
mmetsp:Transcript_2340/g.6522  ORF Transcript_2340/g.6522 Transcript_2340/m.6522 type:complete len:281 (-) Transcript_2340:1322-2164(-)|eukprot:CAMPEP_0119129576 /NCGR_PEP_ID=MMETSP1310-20130426/7265_1 /TAXON_ID=464262 /ORGANISM="Genus nov. species nov., Strain RCC2339" /LENGTH=280 /DNA_ID=CAMNT_0007120007 /DNA_START=85 /DNA_END=927 /DNA_ORIENTATION=+